MYTKMASWRSTTRGTLVLTIGLLMLTLTYYASKDTGKQSWVEPKYQLGQKTRRLQQNKAEPRQGHAEVSASQVPGPIEQGSPWESLENGQKSGSSNTQQQQEELRIYDGSGALVGKWPRWIVVTSINAPTKDVDRLSKLPGWKLVVVGDTKTPTDWRHPNVVFLGVETQKKLGFKIHQHIPYKSYSRKNIGFLFAIKYGAELIYDTDDDNHPDDNLRSFDLDDGPISSILVIKSNKKLYNPYPHFGQRTIWPRGYPLSNITAPTPREYLLCRTRTPQVRQGIVNGDPDVDAIFRLTRKYQDKRIDVLFDKASPRVALPRHTFTPYNTQNTITSKPLFWSLVLPTTVDLRVTDIWRGYWSQTLMWLLNAQIAMYTAGTTQVRSPHSYIKDFIDEQDLYYKAGPLIEYLSKWSCSKTSFFQCHTELMHGIVNQGFVGRADGLLMEAWIEDLKAVGYIEPELSPPQDNVQQCIGARSNVIYYPQEQKATYGDDREYALPPSALRKFQQLQRLLKHQCPHTAPTQNNQLSLNGSSLINDVLLIIHLERMTLTTELLIHLEMFYRPRFGQILYCGQNPGAQQQQFFHTWQASFAEVSRNATDPQMECVYKAADMHYLVSGYLVINQWTLLDMSELLLRPSDKVWITDDWVQMNKGTSSDRLPPCTARTCGYTQLPLKDIDGKVPPIQGGRPLQTCPLMGSGLWNTFSRDRVFFLPSKYNQQLRAASEMKIKGESMLAWIQCTDPHPMSLHKTTYQQSSPSKSDYVQNFDFMNIKSVCSVLGYSV